MRRAHSRRVRLLPPETYHDPGVWSRADFLLDQGITSTATVNIDRVERLGPAPGAFLACRIGGLQHASSSRLLALPAAMRGLPAPLRLTRRCHHAGRHGHRRPHLSHAFSARGL